MVLTLVSEEIKELLKVCKEILNWQKIAYDDKIKPLLESILDEPRKIVAYHLSDGEKTTRIISNEVGAGIGSISRWWTTWINRGIAAPIPKGAGMRAMKSFDLEDYGIAIPDLTQQEEPSEEQEEEEEEMNE